MGLGIKATINKYFKHKADSRIGDQLVKFANSRKNYEKVQRPTGYEDKIEIIIPCYNHSKYLPAAFASVYSQVKPNPVTVTFVDDCSTDDTRKVIKKLCSGKHPSWITTKVLFNKNNLRQWASLNNAIKQSSNELIIILNDDDLLRSDALNKIVDTYKKHTEIYMLGASSIWLEGDSKPKAFKSLPIDKLKIQIHTPLETQKAKELNDLNMTQSSCSFFKLAWEVVGGYRRKEDRIRIDMNEDRDFQYRVASLFPVGTYDDYPLAYWRIDSSHGQDF